MTSRPHTHAGTRATTSCGSGGAASRELRRGVKQVVRVTMGHLRTQRQWSPEEVLAQLPALDNSFHCYELVRQLQGLISSHLSPLVTRRLAGAELEGEEDHHSTAALITEEVLDSYQYKHISQSFTSNLRGTVEELLEDSTHHLLSPAPPSSLSQTTQYFSLDSSMNSDLSQLLGQIAPWSPDQLLVIASDLATSQPHQVRIEAMHNLLQFPVGDLVSMDTWSQLKPVLSDTLMDSDPSLAGMSLTLHSHLLSTHSPTSLEALLSLSHNLSSFFLRGDGVGVTMAMGIDPADDRSVTVLQRMHLLNRFQRDVVSYWVRYGHKTVEELVRATFDLLSLGNDTVCQLRPIHYLSLLDPTAQWARDWTHAEFSRSVVLEAMRERPSLLKDAVRSLMSSRATDDKRKHPQPTTGYYNEASLHYLHFSHSLSVFGQVVRWKNGRSLFPVTLDTGKYSICDVLTHLVNLFYALPPPPMTSDPWSHAHHVTSLDPAHLILHLIQDLVCDSEGSIGLVAHSRVLAALLSPVRSILEGAEPQVAMDTLQRVGQIVSQLVSSESGRSFLLRSEEHLSVMRRFVKYCLVSDTPPVTPVVMTTWLFACRQLYKTGAGLVAMEKYQLHALIADNIMKIGLEEVRGDFTGCGYAIGKELVDNLLGLCWSTRGVGSLGSLPRLLEVCVEYMWGRIKQGLQMSLCDRHGYGSLISQLASTHVGASALIRSGMLSGVLEQVKECGGREEERLTAPWTHPLDSSDPPINKALSRLLNIISHFPVMHQLLNSDLCTSETTPTLISWLIGNDTRTSPQRSSLEYQLIRSRVISMVTTSLDTLILLEDKYSLLQTLLQQQKALSVDNGTVPLDETSIITNRILVAGHLIGGPTERLLPPLSLFSPNEEYPWPLVTDYPLPTCFYSSTSVSMDIDKGSPLYKKLVGFDHPHSRDPEEVWLHEFREVYMEEVEERGSLPNDLVAMVLEGVARTHPLMTSFHEEHSYSYSSQPSQIAVNMILRYGEKLGLLSSPSSPHLPSLTSLLTHHPHNGAESTHHPGFDWLTSVAFLCTRGNVEKTSLISSLLHKFVGPSVNSHTCHIVELVLQCEVPHLAAVFQLAGCSVAGIVSHWTRQVFLNYLDWPHLLLYLTTTSLMGTNYQAYWCVSYLRSKEAAIFLHYQQGDLLPYLLEYPIGVSRDFQASQWMGYMEQLEERFSHLTVT